MLQSLVNLLHGVKGEFPAQEINWDTVLVSDGDLTIPENVKVTVADHAFHFSWDEAQSITIDSPNDRTMILLYNKADRRFQACYSGARRSELKDVFMLRPTRLRNKTYEVFIAFKDVLSDAVSKSIYCGPHTF
ncbi:DUF6266 family protein [Pedobacter sp. NJ-S-72]